MRKCGLTLETDCRHTIQEPSQLEMVVKALGLKPEDVGSIPTTRKIVSPTQAKAHFVSFCRLIGIYQNPLTMTQALLVDKFRY